MNIPTVSELIENFSFFDDWEDRYAYLIDLGDKLPEMDGALKSDINYVRGCTSKVWMVGHFDDDGKLNMLADSDAKIVRGLVAILLSAYIGKSKVEIKATGINDIFAQLGLEGHLSPSRRNGFYAMVERIQTIAAD